MRIIRRLALGASLLATTMLAGATGGGSALAQADTPAVRIGSDNFTEARLVAEIYAQALESAGFSVDRLGGLGTRPDRLPIFLNGQMDLTPDYVGSTLGYFVSHSDDATVDALAVPADGETTRVNLQTALDTLGIAATVLAITPGLDINTLVVRQDTASQYGLTKMSDLAAVQDQLRWGLPPDCDGNLQCQGVLETYGIDFPPAQREALAACSTPLADALAGNAIDVGWLCSTQAPIAQYGFAVLDDDLHLQPADHLAPIVADAWLDQVDGGAATIAAILDPVSARLTTEVLAELNVKTDVDHEDVADVAAEFLASADEPAASAGASPAASPAG